MSVPTVFSSGPSQKTDTPCSGAKVKRLHWLFCMLILTVNICLFQRSLNGYFLADDFLHVDYLHRVMAGNYGALLQNFISNWMQTEGTTFYRPLISLTLASDYLVGSLFGKPFAPWVYHLTNLGFHTASALLMYFVTAKIVERFLNLARGHLSAYIFAFYTALIFSLYPLHCEVINWVIARVDSVSLTFSLLSFWLFLLASEKEDRNLHLAAGFSFVLALMSKEMSVIVPPLAALYLLMVSTGTIKERLVHTGKKTAYLWGIFLFYMVFRFFALGTVSGGYQGSIGAGLSTSLYKRWTDGSLWRLLYPLNEDVFGGKHSLKKLLRTTYLLAIINLPIMAFLSKPWIGRAAALTRLGIFAAVWFVLSLAPTYQVWNLTENLQGGRFAYFATVPLCLLLSLISGAPLFFLDSRAPLRSLARTFSLALCAILVFSFARITAQNNLVWVQAQRELKQFRKALEETVLKTPDKKIALLNIPQSLKGAHMLYNAATMSVMLSPTLSQGDVGKQILTFEPALFGDAELIKAGRVREMLKDKTIKFYRWDREKQKLIILELKPDSAQRANSLVLYKETGKGETLKENTRLVSPPLSDNPLAFDRLVIMLSEKVRQDCGITLSVYGDDGEPPFIVTTPLQKGSQTITIELSERKGYLALSRITGIALSAAATSEPIKLDSVALEKLTDLPSLAVDGKDLVMDNDGIARKRGARPSFNYDVSNIPGAHSAYLELSGPNSWFEHYSGTYRESQLSGGAPAGNGLSSSLSQVKGQHIPLTVSGLAADARGFYELRIIALDLEGRPIGYFSEPICFQI